MSTTRRDFLKLACTAASLACVGMGTHAVAAEEAAGLEECLSQDPVAMAKDSPMVRDAWNLLEMETGRLQDSGLRALVAEVYADTAPRLAVRLDHDARRHVWEELRAKEYTYQSLEDFLPPVPENPSVATPFIAAPGSGYQSHHAYPGGLVTHTAANVVITRAITDAYVRVYGYAVDADIAMAAQLLHDVHKPYVFQWQQDASSRTERSLAGTGEHHVLSLAEMLVRKAPGALVVAQACAHTHPGTPEEERQVVGWLKAAAIIAGVDPVACGLLETSGTTLPLPRRQEGFLCHLGDHDFVLSVPAVQWTLPVMRQVAARTYGLSERDILGRPFNALRNRVYSRVSAMRLHQAYAEQGEQGVEALMVETVLPPRRT